MANMFQKYAADRKAEQKKIEKAVVADATADEKRTTLSLSLTVSDKKALKMMAAEHEATIAAIIHKWIQEHLEEVKE
jgi:flagellar biosynthesis/type III secretory pathway M-ring protein FliF/YscJ